MGPPIYRRLSLSVWTPMPRPITLPSSTGSDRELGDREFPATRPDIAPLDWVLPLGQSSPLVSRAPAPTAPLCRVLAAAGVIVLEVDRPDRAAAERRQVRPSRRVRCGPRGSLGPSRGPPKSRDGIVESIRCLRVAQRSAMKAKTQCINQVRAILVNGPAELREQMKPMGTTADHGPLWLLRPGRDLAYPVAATKLALRSLARRHVALDAEIKDLDMALTELTATAAPGLLARFGVGAEVAGQLLVTAGDNPDRLRSEASFAHLAGVAPIPASSGAPRATAQSRRGPGREQRPLRRGARPAEVRPADPRLRATTHLEGLSTKDIIRCLKRAIARELYQELTRPTGFTTTSPPTTRYRFIAG